MKRYAKAKGLDEFTFFIDEDIGGGNFDRAGFQSMIEKIKQGEINCVVVKDLSRFGREHIEGDYLLEVFFPENNVRVITEIEGIDSFLDAKRMDSIEIPLINLFNEQYLRQVSNSTKSSLKLSRKEGKYVGSIVPYGYKRNKSNRHNLVIDEEVRQIVELIFKRYLGGAGFTTIANSLNADGILPPNERRKQLNGKNNIDYSKGWTNNSVRGILKQQLLTGDMVQGKTISYSFKVKKRQPLPKDKWVIVENMHEAIIDKQTFQVVQDLIAKKVKPHLAGHKKQSPCVLSGFIYCADCGKPLVRTYSTHKGVRYNHMICSTYKKLGASHCSNHLLAEQKIIEVTLTTINKMVDTLFDADKAIKKSKQQELSRIRTRLDLKVSKLKNNIKRVSNAKQELYIDYKDEILSKADFLDMKCRFDKDYSELNDQLKRAEYDLSNVNNGEFYSSVGVKTFQSFQNIDELTKEVLTLLVENIIIDKEKNIKIIFKLRDELKTHLSYFDNESADTLMI